jgi:hypothetical protein
MEEERSEAEEGCPGEADAVTLLHPAAVEGLKIQKWIAALTAKISSQSEL